MLCQTTQPLKFCLTFDQSLYTLLSYYSYVLPVAVYWNICHGIFFHCRQCKHCVCLNALCTDRLTFTLLKLTSFCEGNCQHHWGTFRLLSYIYTIGGDIRF